MQELMIDVITSVEGYAAAEGWPGFWGLESPEYLGWLDEEARTERTVLMGATTYRLMHGFAPTRPDDPDPLGAVPKVVFSSTLTEPLEWANSRLVRGDAVEAVRAMKADGDRPLSTLGSLSLARTLLAAGLVDRYRVVVFPVVTGATGRERVYDGWPDVGLELTEARTFDGGIQLLDYVPRLLEGPIRSGDGAG